MSDERMETLCKEFEAEVRKRAEGFPKQLSGERKKFFDEIDTSGRYVSNTFVWGFTSSYAVDLYEGLNSGKYKKPSHFVRKELDWLFSGYIYARFREALCYTLDHYIEWPYSQSYYRRPFRTRVYDMKRMLRIIYDFHETMTIDADVADILQLKLPERERAYFMHYNGSWRQTGIAPEVIAYELEQGNAGVEAALTDIINGEGEITFHRNFIQGIVRSNNRSMQEQLGKLLLAARLQEGLRQAICESMDMGTISSFRSLLSVIEEQNLIRFSSVKRAVGTWLGLIAEESGDLERISDKSIRDISYVLEDSGHIEEYLATEDSMKIYIALWAIGVYDVQDALNRVKDVARTGTHHQILTTGYFCANLDNQEFAHTLAKNVIREQRDQYDILAVYMPHFMRDWDDYARREEDRRKLTLERYFDNQKEAEAYYQLLLALYQEMPKNSLDFSPCIFPWYSASLTKSAFISRMCVIARMLRDNEKLDECCPWIKDCDTSERGLCLAYALEQPETKIQRTVVTEALCNKESWTRNRAKEIIQHTTLEEENYRQMESMLKYKAADMRETLISLLYQQENEKLLETIRRLLEDKKEEKRTAGLDLVMQVMKDEKKKSLQDTCRQMIRALENLTAKEQILADNILGQEQQASAPGGKSAPLYREEDAYVPKLGRTGFIDKCIQVFLEYFPDSEMGAELAGTESQSKQMEGFRQRTEKTGAKSDAMASVKEDCASLHKLFEAHELDEYRGYGGEMYTLSSGFMHNPEFISENKRETPCLSLWKEWYEGSIHDIKRLLRMHILLSASREENQFQDVMKPQIRYIFGAGYEAPVSYKYYYPLARIVERLLTEYADTVDYIYPAAALAYWYVTCLPQEQVLLPFKEGEVHFITHPQINAFFSSMTCNQVGEVFEELFPLVVAMSDKTFARAAKRPTQNIYVSPHGVDERFQLRGTTYIYSNHFQRPDVKPYLIAAYRGIISKEAMYEYLFRQENRRDALSTLSILASGFREQGRSVANRKKFGSWKLQRQKAIFQEILNRPYDSDREPTAEEEALLQFANQVYETMTGFVLDIELRRGDSETEYSRYINSIERIYGMEYFITILKALGADKLERSTYYTSESKKGCLSHLLSVCIPEAEDSAQKLAGMLKGTGITEKRLLEAALYSPEWMNIIGEYLQWEGFQSVCYYFMAHMNESFDDVRRAMIAKYTPLSEDELKLGAFDIHWFRSAYETMGEKRFNLVYDAAKYISDGAKHARARKYADAVLGKLKKEEVEQKVSDKRNKDLLMAYGLIPLDDKDDVFRRYLFLQGFLKESKKFGAQRIASEKAAVEIAMSNLAMNAGYSDVTRLTLQMETKLLEDVQELFEAKEIEDIRVRLQVDENGRTEICCEKNGKALKSIPTKYKKNEHVILLTETKKKLTDQLKRTKVMFEQAMEDETVFTVEEIIELHKNPVVCPIVKSLLFKCGDRIGFLEQKKLLDYAGTEVPCKKNAEVTVAHPFHIYQDGHWSDYQRLLCEKQITQSFKQVFRELYVKTEEELAMEYSRRYAGHQIQPKKTVACLKTRRWVADVEDGLQKVYYRENIIARIYALADWFSPADIEAPTLEWVEFSDRKTGKRLRLENIPDVIFSEVMRDVDLAVSVAHVGGVDPETSHSTIEMRAALLTCTLPLFKLTNVTVSGNHAVVTGTYGTYTIHLGSGVVHMQGGTMIHVLPVHSQHRGKLFLPFADDDPKTAEIMTKVLLFAEDKKIKDPTILEQIRR
ncbi:MAG: DUF4132 domain-containing protein [Clostridium sp.]|nr:DUF4132 domain-containing protein [Clostridium sp.]MCM1534676.1 DUF4132 domain-containing protein [Clostridium sp.]